MTATQSEIRDLSHEIWAAAQLLPNEGIEDGVERIETILQSALDTQKPAGAAVRERLSAIQKRLEDAGVLDVKFATSPDGDRSKLAEEMITVLEAVLDGKYSPARPFDDSTLTGDCGGGDIVYYSHEADNFYNLKTRKGMGTDFYKKHIDDVKALTTTTASTTWTIQQHLNNIALFKSRLANPAYFRAEDQNYMCMEIIKAEAAIEEIKNVNK